MKRVLTALLLVPAVTWVILWAPQWAFLAVLAAVGLLCFHEYSAIVRAQGIAAPGPLGYAAGLLLIVLPEGHLLLVTLVALCGLALAMRAANLADVLPRAAALAFGVLYTFGPWRAADALRNINPYWLLFALAVNWVGDTAALYVGRAFGKHKLAPRVSPSKSWEGAVASLAASLIFGVLFAWRLIPNVSLEVALGLAAAGNLAGQIGDLAESAIKRGAGIKDSGALLPGHGGWLDRTDASLFSIPLIYLLLSR